MIISNQEKKIEDLESKTVKPDDAKTELMANSFAGILWFASGEDSLKYALSFVQDHSKLEAKPSLYFITQGIQPIGPITDLDNATFNGFFRTLKLEMSTLDCRHIDIPSTEKFPLQELLAKDQEDQIAYRQGVRYAARLVHKELNGDRNELKIDPAGSYLITGGLGGLGLEVAKWLVKKGAIHLVLVGRRASQDISIPNATVVTATVDIAKNASVQELMQKFGNDWPELKGVIHAAGILGEGNYLPAQNWNQFEKVFAPKVQGSWNLHETSLTKPLDFFVLFSSLSSVLGLPRESDYAAANAYMDALAYLRREKGLPALAIGWGNWAEVGMAAKIEGRKAGQKGLTPDMGVHALELALTQISPHVSIVDMDWNIYPHRQDFLRMSLFLMHIKKIQCFFNN